MVCAEYAAARAAAAPPVTPLRDDELARLKVDGGATSVYQLKTPEGTFDIEHCVVLVKASPPRMLVIAMPFSHAVYSDRWLEMAGTLCAGMIWRSGGADVDIAQPIGESTEDIGPKLAAPREPGFVPAQLAAPPGVDMSPLLVFMESPMTVNLISAVSTLPTYWAPTVAHVTLAMLSHSPCGILAQSPLKSSGAAYEAIRRFRLKSSGLVIYNSWDYRMEVAAPRALRARADLLLVGGAPPHEMMAFILTGLDLKRTGMPEPSAEFYEAFIRKTMPRSNAWQMAQMMRTKDMPPSASE